jgi:hypothetical protein
LLNFNLCGCKDEHQTIATATLEGKTAARNSRGEKEMKEITGAKGKKQSF